MLLELLGFVQSDDSLCGVASVRSVLYYYGIDSSEDLIAIACNHRYELGCTNEDMVEALKVFGLGAFLQKNGTIDDLIYWNKHRTPVIVDFFTPSIAHGREDMPNGHSGVIVDVDKTNVYLLDPEHGKIRAIQHSEFERVWLDWSGSETIQADTVLDIGVMIIPYAKRLIS